MANLKNLARLPGTPGTSVTRAVVDADDGSATISGRLTTEVSSLSDMERVNVALPATFGGQPLRTIHVQARGAGGAYYWGRYRRKRISTTLTERYKRHVGYTWVEWWGSLASETTIHTEADPRTKALVARQRRIRASLITITWGKEQASRPQDTRFLENTRNGAPYKINNVQYPAGSLLFVGTVVRHLKDGGIDRWIYRHTVMYRGFYSTSKQLRYWEESELDVDNASPAQLKHRIVGPYLVRSWPNLPV